MPRTTFAQFMQEALYAPHGGYYTSGVRRIGERADYVTASAISEFGACIARWVFSRWEALGNPEHFTVLELGAGDGTLARSILQYLAAQHNFVPAYFAVEVSGHQKEPGISWLVPENIGAAYDGAHSGKMQGVVISNEFFDALPVHRVVWQGGALQEIFVEKHTTNGYREITGELSSPAIGACWKNYGIPLSEGQQAEANLEALRWTETISGILERGYVLTIDYGDAAEKLYTPARFDGTLMGYRNQQAIQNPYDHAGEQDITAHVNFTALMGHGKKHGLKTVSFSPLANFLVDNGILAPAVSPMPSLEAARESQRIKKLLLPGGYGEIFKALVQEKK